jgi:hypothetical protein
MKDKKWKILILGTIILLVLSNIGVVWGQPKGQYSPRPPFDVDPDDLPRIRRLLEGYFIGRSVISVINSILLLYLLLVYYGIYRETGSSFSLGLVVTAITLLTYTLTSNPLIHWAFGYRALFGVFNFIPDIFTTIAAVVLIYLSRQ